MTQAQTYQTVLQQLSQLPASRLNEVRDFLDKISPKKSKGFKSFAGIWSDMPDENFEDLLQEIEKNRDSINKEFNERSNY
jgi:hypothetical protein